MISRRRIGGVAALSGAVLLVLAGCSGGESDDPETPEVTNTQEIAEELDRQEVEALYERYWELRIQSENEAEIEPGMFTGVLDTALAEDQASKIQNYQRQNLVRVGEPQITEVEVRLEGDTAVVLACQNEDEWLAEMNGEPIPPPEVLGTVPVRADVERRDDGWLIVALDTGEGEKECDT